jgi:hypothetical protein
MDHDWQLPTYWAWYLLHPWAVFGLHVIGLTENHAWIYCGIPVGIIYGIKIWPKFPKITGFGQREV